MKCSHLKLTDRHGDSENAIRFMIVAGLYTAVERWEAGSENGLNAGRPESREKVTDLTWKRRVTSLYLVLHAFRDKFAFRLGSFKNCTYGTGKWPHYLLVILSLAK